EVDCFQGWMNISGSGILGEETYISCSYLPVPHEVVSFLYIWPHSVMRGSEFYFMITEENVIYLGASHHDRLSVTVNRTSVVGTTSIAKTATMKIADLQCSDEQNYGCAFHYRAPREISVTTFMISERLIIKARPSPPVVTLETSNTQLQQENVHLSERSTVVARCKANVGRPERGSIGWRVVRQNVIENIAESDNRVATVSDVLSETINCTLEVEQTLTLTVTKQDLNVSIVCFVNNSDFPIKDITVSCRNGSSQLCGQTQAFSILFGEGQDGTSTLLMGGIVLVAGFLTAVLVDIIYHYVCKKKPPPAPPRKSAPAPPPKSPPKDKQEPPEEAGSEVYEEIESITEEEVNSEGGSVV
ncbi:unnamed protein product, partial [Candidula unifasciata]